MSKAKLKDRIKEGVFLLDGAMGTQLFLRGVKPGKCNDYLNIESPDIIFEIQRSYVDAGSDCLTSNTFSSNRYSLVRHGLGEQVVAINKAGAEIARKAVGIDGYVLGDISSTGDFLEPLGTLKADELQSAFAEQAKGLLEGGVDGIIIETMSALDETEVAIKAVKSVCDLPIFVSLAFDAAGDDFRTMMGVSVEAAVEKLVPLGIDVIGFNCGTVSLEGYVKLAEKFSSAVKASGFDVGLLAEPNAGLPELVDEQAVYKVSGEDFAATAAQIHSLGFNILGGCCGTSPELIKAVSEKLR